MDILKVLNLIKDTLPHTMDMKPNGRVTPDVHSWGEMGYFENESLMLHISFVPASNHFEIYYYSDADEHHHFEYCVDEKTTKKDLHKMFKDCFDVSLTYFINKEKKLIEKIKAENNLQD